MSAQPSNETEKVASDNTTETTAAVSEKISATSASSTIEAMDVQADGECAKIVAEPGKTESSGTDDHNSLNGRTPTPEEGSSPLDGNVNGTDGKATANGTSSEGNGAEVKDEPAANEQQATVAGQQATAATEEIEKQHESDKDKQSLSPDKDKTCENSKNENYAEGSGCKTDKISDSGKEANVTENNVATEKEPVNAETTEIAEGTKSTTAGETDENKCESKSTEGMNATNAVEERDVKTSSDQPKAEHSQNGEEAIANGSSGVATGSGGVDNDGDSEVRTSATDLISKTSENDDMNEQKSSENEGSNEKSAAVGEFVNDKAEDGGDSKEAIDSAEKVAKNKLIPQISITEAEPMEEEPDVKIVFDKPDSKPEPEEAKAESKEVDMITEKSGDEEITEAKAVDMTDKSKSEQSKDVEIALESKPGPCGAKATIETTESG